ncbi:MAG TPA: hypothetical protein PKY77_12780 [Phycisphaerae bacterium]|nr:hypothetical protein [Phycisphaerae bacterium]HRY69204.1 hypothetical protein [Phycisphaerae bacterium]HSA26165.1 hypothetical protein [Phycisphaerae bacterium]
MKHITLRAQKATPELMENLERRGLLRRLVPSEKARTVSENDQFVERVELAAEDTGPWQMLVVACNRTKLDHLAAHGDAESWLFFADPASKPLLYVLGTCPAAEFQAKAAEGDLTAGDFFILELQPNDPETSYFTVPGGVLHDELTYPGPGLGPIFYVPEPSRMGHTRIPLDAYDFEILRP